MMAGRKEQDVEDRLYVRLLLKMDQNIEEPSVPIVGSAGFIDLREHFFGTKQVSSWIFISL